MGELHGGEIVAVISNHPDCQEAADHFGVPYYHIPMTDGKVAAETAQLALLQDLAVDLRGLSPLCANSLG